MTPTNAQIDHLIATRERLTNRRDEQIDYTAVALIDDVLREVAPGQRNDVDLLLGRLCAQLPTRADYNPLEGVDWTPIKAELNAERAAMIERDMQAAAHEAGVTAEWTPAHTPTDAEYEAMSAGRPDGIVDHDDTSAGMWM
jgi:hypothetical protein